MPKPDYKKLTEDLLGILKITPEPNESAIKNKIIDLTKELVGTVYQFTCSDLLFINENNKIADNDDS